jgi:LysR family transcriptional activator of nhaA
LFYFLEQRMAALNFHHLRYFRAVARAGTLTRAAAALHISPSALSVQVQHLEAQLGQSLFERRGRQLILTEAGRIALDHAETIFAAGDELVQTLKGGPAHRPATVRVGALATLSRNFQVSFLAPLRKAASLHLVLRSGTLSELLAALQAHQLDVLLTNTLPARDKDSAWTAHQLAEQPISIIGPKLRGRRPAPDALLAREPLIVPTVENHIRGDFDAYLQRKSIAARIVAEVDDMAMIRVLAREGLGYAIAPQIVVQDELKSGELVDYGHLADLKETFYALAPKRRYPNKHIAEALAARKA